VADRYPNFAALNAEEERGLHFQVWLEDRGTPIVVLAPHGGWIEPGTSEIAKAIAGDDLSIYSFESLVPGRPHSDLHITSTRFDEPEGLALARAAETAVAIHGRANSGDLKTIGLGGRDLAFRDAIARALRAAGFSVAIAPPDMAARDPSNICNRGTSGAGVQLELPLSLRRRLVGNPTRLRSFCDAVRNAMST
jgi:phage replication-related protein YjqB (UPF0714/DUF867 family)